MELLRDLTVWQWIGAGFVIILWALIAVKILYKETTENFLGFIVVWIQFHIFTMYRRPLPAWKHAIYTNRLRYLGKHVYDKGKWFDRKRIKWEMELIHKIFHISGFFKSKTTGKFKSKLQIKFWKKGKKTTSAKIAKNAGMTNIELQQRMKAKQKK